MCIDCIEEKSLYAASLTCALLALILYGVTIAPTFGWGDSADLAMRMVYDGDPTFLNSSRDYALYRWIGGLFQFLPIGDVGTRANLMTAFFGAATIGLVSWLSGYIARNVYAAYSAGIALTVSHTFWLMSVIAEVYTFNATLVFACYACMAVWWRTENLHYLAGAVLFAGLALSHHSTGLVLCATLAPLILARIRRLPWWNFFVLAVIFIAASSLYWDRTYLRLMADQPLMKAMNLQTPTNPFFAVAPTRELMKFLAFAFYNYLGPGFFMAAWSIVIIWQKKLWEMLPPLLWLGLMLFAGVTSSIPDKFNIYVLLYPVLAMAIGLAAVHMRERFPKNDRLALWLLIALAVLPPVGYLTTVHAAKWLKIDLVGARVAPYRDNDWYFMWPSKLGDHGPRRYAEEALESIDPKGVLIADYSLWRPIYLLQAVESKRTDVTLIWAEPLMWKGPITDYIATIPCGTSIYLATNTPAEYYQLEEITKRYRIKPTGVTFKVLRGCAHKAIN